MRHDSPRLAEALTEERAWDADGVTVLRASVTLPQLAPGGQRARRFNRYYRRFCRAYFAYCAQVLLPEAAASCRDAMAVSAPWSVARAELTFRVVFRRGALWSVVCDARECVCGQPPFLLRRSDVWDLNAGLPVPPEEFFPPHRRCKRELLRFARAEMQRRAQQGFPCRENWRAMLRRALNLRNCYPVEEGLCFFYPPGAVADEKGGIVTFTMPYDTENGPFLPPEE